MFVPISTSVNTEDINKTLSFCLFSQYLMIQQTPFVRRQVRKLLLFICGSKEKYRQLRDLHTLDSHVCSIKKLLEEQGIFLRAGVVTVTSGSALQYDTLINLVSVLLTVASQTAFFSLLYSYSLLLFFFILVSLQTLSIHSIVPICSSLLFFVLFYDGVSCCKDRAYSNFLCLITTCFSWCRWNI